MMRHTLALANADSLSFKFAQSTSNSSMAMLTPSTSVAHLLAATSLHLLLHNRRQWALR